MKPSSQAFDKAVSMASLHVLMRDQLGRVNTVREPPNSVYWFNSR
jgi:hypothetical protein